jgi:hypothetical protein
MSEPRRIRYRFDLPDGSVIALEFDFDPIDFRMLLEELYRNLHVVNRDMSRRLGAATRTDPARNAMALLDSVTTLLSDALECSLNEFKLLFDAWQTKRIPAI